MDGERCSASLFDFGLFFFHNARATLAVGEGPYFYLPKMESHLEARWASSCVRVCINGQWGRGIRECAPSCQRRRATWRHGGLKAAWHEVCAIGEWGWAGAKGACADQTRLRLLVGARRVDRVCSVSVSVD